MQWLTMINNIILGRAGKNFSTNQVTDHAKIMIFVIDL